MHSIDNNYVYFVSRQKFLLLSLKAKQNKENISKHILLHVEIFVARDGCSQKIIVNFYCICGEWLALLRKVPIIYSTCLESDSPTVSSPHPGLLNK